MSYGDLQFGDLVALEYEKVPQVDRAAREGSGDMPRHLGLAVLGNDEKGLGQRGRVLLVGFDLPPVDGFPARARFACILDDSVFSEGGGDSIGAAGIVGIEIGLNGFG